MNMSGEDSLPAVIAQAVEPAPSADHAPALVVCANCGTPLLGAHCHACGQPVKGMIRPLSSMLSDIADTIFNIDSRIFRTLVPLYFRPGYLTNEYFAGRRVRYVTPFRLYFFLSIAAFFALQSTFGDIDSKHIIDFGSDSDSNISEATSVERVTTLRDAKLAALDKAHSAVAGIPGGATKGVEKAADKIRSDADKRLAYFASVDAAKAKGEPPPTDPALAKADVIFGNQVWDADKHPVNISWLPNVANAKLNAWASRMRDNLDRIRKDPKPFISGSIGALSPVLFFMMPLFALLLKLFFIFKRRLYMEHLIVALHSHSFIFLSLLLIALAAPMRAWAHTDAPWLEPEFGWLIFAMGWWLPIYLLIMQKRVYGQGWILTVIKYCVIGLCYFVLIVTGIVAAFLVSLATT